jgi:hypothetical protein
MREYDKVVRAIREAKAIQIMSEARKGIPTLRAGAGFARPSGPRKRERQASDFVQFSGSPNRAERRKHKALRTYAERYVERACHRTDSGRLARLITRDAEIGA